MTKDELKAELDARGIRYDGRASTETLQELLDSSTPAVDSGPQEISQVSDQAIAAGVREAKRVESRRATTVKRFRAELTVYFDDRTEFHNYYLTGAETEALVSLLDANKSETGIKFALIYRTSGVPHGLNGFTDDATISSAIEAVRQGTK